MVGRESRRKIKGLQRPNRRVEMKTDKLLHILAGYAITLTLGLWIHPAYAFGLGVIAGAIKEIVWDGLMKRGTVDFWDGMATMLGSFVAMAVTILKVYVF